MSANNGTPTAAEYKVKLAQAEELVEKLRAEQMRIDDQVAAYERHLEEVRAAAAAAGVAAMADGGIRRSKLSALEKSRLIDQLGKDRYMTLPWDDGKEPRDEAARRPTWSPNWR
jgi:hypothetical protein